jgi:hypothetical protein
MTYPIETWFRVATETSVIKRSLKVMVSVGTVLMLINNGDYLLNGDFDMLNMGGITLTYLVPFSVATYSSVASRLESQTLSTDIER